MRHTEQRTSDGPRGTAPERDPDRKAGGQRWGTNRGDEAASGFGQVVIRTLASGPGQPGARAGPLGSRPGQLGERAGGVGAHGRRDSAAGGHGEGRGGPGRETGPERTGRWGRPNRATGEEGPDKANRPPERKLRRAIERCSALRLTPGDRSTVDHHSASRPEGARRSARCAPRGAAVFGPVRTCPADRPGPRSGVHQSATSVFARTEAECGPRQSRCCALACRQPRQGRGGPAATPPPPARCTPVCTKAQLPFSRGPKS